MLRKRPTITIAIMPDRRVARCNPIWYNCRCVRQGSVSRVRASQIESHRGQRRVITLTTDFGTVDGYVAAMKGVILGINPEAIIVDVTHEIRPQDIREGAFVFGSTFEAFPPDTVHVVVVDPGVGSARRPIAVSTPAATFVAPDNGVLSWALRVAEADRWPVQAREIPLPVSTRAVVLKNSTYWRPRVSATFHGRDIFAPVAAHLSGGTPLAELGPSTQTLCLFPVPRAKLIASGKLEGHVIHVDRFGNLITDVTEADLSRFTAPTVRIGNVEIPQIVTHYAAGAVAGSKVLALLGSAGYLEIAVAQGSAAAALGLDVGTVVTVLQAGEER